MVHNNFGLAICTHLGVEVEGCSRKPQGLGEGVRMKTDREGGLWWDKGNFRYHDGRFPFSPSTTPRYYPFSPLNPRPNLVISKKPLQLYLQIQAGKYYCEPYKSLFLLTMAYSLSVYSLKRNKISPL